MQPNADSACTKIQRLYQNELRNDMKIVQKSGIRTPQSTLQHSILNERIIDKISIIIFPFSFVVFNVTYWIIYI